MKPKLVRGNSSSLWYKVLRPGTGEETCRDCMAFFNTQKKPIKNTHICFSLCIPTGRMHFLATDSNPNHHKWLIYHHFYLAITLYYPKTLKLSFHLKHDLQKSESENWEIVVNSLVSKYECIWTDIEQNSITVQLLKLPKHKCRLPLVERNSTLRVS